MRLYEYSKRMWNINYESYSLFRYINTDSIKYNRYVLSVCLDSYKQLTFYHITLWNIVKRFNLEYSDNDIFADAHFRNSNYLFFSRFYNVRSIIYEKYGNIHAIIKIISIHDIYNIGLSGIII